MSTCCEPRRWRAAVMMVGVEAETRGGLDAGGCAGNAEAKLVVGHEGDFVDTGSGVEHAGRVGGVDLERGVVGGDERPCAGGEEVCGDGDGERGAFFRIGGGAELVEKDERMSVGEAREAIEVEDVSGEGGELGLDGLGIADVGEECGEDGEAGGGSGDGQAGLGHHGQQRGGFEGDGFAAGVGAADDELAGLGGEFQCKRDNMTAGGAEVSFRGADGGRRSRRRRSGVMAGATQS